MERNLKNWQSFNFSFEFTFPLQIEDGKKQKRIKIEHPIYYQGEPENPGVIILHELPGMTPEFINFAEGIRAEGYSVYLPLLFGKPYTPGLDRVFNLFRGTFCLLKEFNSFAIGKDSSISVWLKALSQKVNQTHGRRGIGVIGMCFTGGFVLSVMVDESVLAPVISQPALPVYFFRFWQEEQAKRDLAVSRTTINNAKKRNIPVLGLKFSEDCFSPEERFETFKQEFAPAIDLKQENPETYTFTQGLFHHYVITKKQIEQAQQDGFPHKGNHSVLTVHYVDQIIDGKKHPTQEARDWVVTFLNKQLA